eukprot:1825361-Amphidinium_carterae.1
MGLATAQDRTHDLKNVGKNAKLAKQARKQIGCGLNSESLLLNSSLQLFLSWAVRSLDAHVAITGTGPLTALQQMEE